jgi:hypothetical protein
MGTASPGKRPLTPGEGKGRHSCHTLRLRVVRAVRKVNFAHPFKEMRCRVKDGRTRHGLFRSPSDRMPPMNRTVYDAEILQ